MKHNLLRHEVASGDKVNVDKTTTSFSKRVVNSKRFSIAGILGINVVDVHDRYLGLSTVVGRSKKGYY